MLGISTGYDNVVCEPTLNKGEGSKCVYIFMTYMYMLCHYSVVCVLISIYFFVGAGAVVQFKFVSNFILFYSIRSRGSPMILPSSGGLWYRTRARALEIFGI